MLYCVIAETNDGLFFSIFKSLVLDKISWMKLTEDPRKIGPSVGITPFHDRLIYFYYLRKMGELCDCLRMSLVWFHHLAQEEIRAGGTTPSWIAIYIRSRLSNGELACALSEMTKSLQQNAADDPTREIINLQFAQVQTNRLLLAIFESPTILQGLRSPEALTRAATLISEMKDPHVKRLSRALAMYYQDYSLIGIALAGLVLSQVGVPCRESLCLELNWSRWRMDRWTTEKLNYIVYFERAKRVSEKFRARHYHELCGGTFWRIVVGSRLNGDIVFYMKSASLAGFVRLNSVEKIS